MDWFAVSYVVLTIASIAAAVGFVALWRALAAPHMATGLALAYYYSLFGAWRIVSLKQTGQEAEALSHLESSLFAVTIDDNYVLALVVYAVFLLAIVCAACLLTRNNGRLPPLRHADLRLRHGWILAISLTCLAISIGIEWQGIRSALEEGIAAYASTRAGESRLYTLHQLANRIGLAALAIGLGACLAVRTKLRPVLVCYAMVALAWGAFLAVLGNRAELLIAAVAGFLWYYSLGGRMRPVAAVVTAGIGFLVLRIVEATRGTAVTEATAGLGQLLSSFDFWNPLNVLAGSESLAAHLSLYGVLSHDIPFTYGSSFLYLVSSFVPRVLLVDRPADIYTIYIDALSVADQQGFNIHYATGWYLNFGLAGIILGALIVVGIWGWLLRTVQRLARTGSRFAVHWNCTLCFCLGSRRR
jgi:hypothetical protein